MTSAGAYDYDDFELGQEYKFALALYPRNLAVQQLKVVAVDGAVCAPYLFSVGHACYDVNGSVIFCSADAWAINVGVSACAYQWVRPPANAAVGASVSGQVYIGIDENPAERPGMPDLSRLWLLRRILLETTRWVDAFDEAGRKFQTRDESKRAYIEVSATAANNHDKGTAHYLLECELLESLAV